MNIYVTTFALPVASNLHTNPMQSSNFFVFNNLAFIEFHLFNSLNLAFSLHYYSVQANKGNGGQNRNSVSYIEGESPNVGALSDGRQDQSKEGADDKRKTE